MPSSSSKYSGAKSAHSSTVEHTSSTSESQSLSRKHQAETETSTMKDFITCLINKV